VSRGLTNIAAAALVAYGAHGCHHGWNGFGWVVFVGLATFVSVKVRVTP
jgi:hypothetical protein